MVAPTRVLPASGFVLEVEYASKDGAWSKAEELKRRRPMLQVEIYDAVRKAREEVRLPPG